MPRISGPSPEPSPGRFAGVVALTVSAGTLMTAMVGAGHHPSTEAAPARGDSADSVNRMTGHQSARSGGMLVQRPSGPTVLGRLLADFPVFVEPDGVQIVPDGDSPDLDADSEAAFRPASLPWPPSSGRPRLPRTVYTAYRAAEARQRAAQPGCHLEWPLLAGIGEIESTQAYDGRLRADGTSYPPIYGPTLDGRDGYMTVPDTDHGRLDADRIWDRAVGPMQFMPATWNEWGTDGNGDGRADPQNIYDASLTAARYLCANGRDLDVARQYDRAVLSYNDDEDYLEAVRAWAGYYRRGEQSQNPDPSPIPVPAPAPAPHPAPTPRPSVRPTAGASAKPTVSATATAKPAQRPTTATPRPSTSGGSGSVKPGPAPRLH